MTDLTASCKLHAQTRFVERWAQVYALLKAKLPAYLLAHY